MTTDAQIQSLERVAKDQNYYAVHLSEVNRNQDVTATGDIYAENGLLIVPKGTRIDHATADRILQFRLIQPLEEQVQLERALTHEEMNKEFKAHLDSYPDAMEMHSACDFQKKLDRLLESAPVKPMLLQELTVLRDRLPKEFRKTIFCTWFSTLIASELGMKDDAVLEVLLVGLSHDIGLLHISAETINKKGPLTPAEWRAIQSHVILGHLLVRKLYGDASGAAMAVLEHHERCDGSGYPVGKTDEQLGVAGQIMGIADSIQAIRVGQFSSCGRNLRDVMPYLHMNSRTHFPIVYEAVCSILARSGLQPSCVNPFGDIDDLVVHLLARGERLQKAVALLQKLDIAGLGNAENHHRKLLKIVKPVVSMITSSGLVASEVITWLEHLKREPSGGVLSDLTEMELMQNELYWQMKKVCRAIDQCLDANENDAPFMQQLAETSKKISEFISGLV